MKKLKIILIGESGVGKSSLITQYIEKKYNLELTFTISNDRRLKPLSINGKKINLEIWDTVGQEKLRNINKMFMKNVQIAIFVYDITKKKSIINFDSYWYKEVCNENDIDKVIFGIVANKTDLYQKQEIDQIEGIQLAQNIGAKFFETSATNFESIQTVFEELAQDYISKFSDTEDIDKDCRPSCVLNPNINNQKRNKNECCLKK